MLGWKGSEDSLAVRMQEKSLGRFKESWPNMSGSSSSDSSKGDTDNKIPEKKKRKGGGVSLLPQAPFGLTKKQMEQADLRTKQISCPAGDTFCAWPIFSHISRMNSHEWKEVI